MSLIDKIRKWFTSAKVPEKDSEIEQTLTRNAEQEFLKRFNFKPSNDKVGQTFITNKSKTEQPVTQRKEPEYFKKLGIKWDNSKAGQTFITSVKKQVPKDTLE